MSNDNGTITRELDRGRPKEGYTRPNTRLESKRTSTHVAIESISEIKDSKDARTYLEKGLYLCPAGEMVSPTSLKYCLHQISRMAGITVAIGKAVRSAALLVEEMEEYAIAETIRKTVNTQLTAITEDLQILTSDVREKIDQKMEESSKELDKYTDNLGRLITKLESTAHVVSQPNTTNNTTLARDGTRTYAQATVSPPAHANPKLAAREGIRARQFMLEGVDRESKIGGMNNSQLKSEFERILRETGIEGKGLRMVTKQRLSGILIETDNDKIAAWLRKESTAEEFCEKIGPGAKFKTRTYDLIAYNVPLTLEPTNPNHLTEINEVNQLDPGVIKSARGEADRKEIA